MSRVTRTPFVWQEADQCKPVSGVRVLLEIKAPHDEGFIVGYWDGEWEVATELLVDDYGFHGPMFGDFHDRDVKRWMYIED